MPIRPRANGRPVCSGCGKRRPGYDRLQPRRFEFVPLWQIAVVFVYALRRVDCPRCGVVVEQVPWASGKSRLTTSYQWFLAGWARRLSWKEVATVFHTTWEHVRDSVRHAVRWGLVHRDLTGAQAIGVDEIQWQRGHHYLTLVYQIDAGCRRLLWIGRERTEASLRGGLDLLGDTFCSGLRFVCSDLWQPYLKVLAEQAGGAIHVLDRFHIMKQLGKAIDDIRAAEAKRLRQRRLRTAADAFPLVPAQAAREPHRPADRQARRTAQVQSAKRAGLLASRRLSTLLGVPIARLGRPVPRRVVLARDAFPAGAAEEGGPQLAFAPGTLAQLVPGQRHDFEPASSRVLTTKRN